ncbi:hypothetical protein AB1K62_14235 [Parasphingorhabdus sp. JC815]|uniref:hypothetical protein n=1 Tax=Parasphingorhabdus sp. JC815 TaxID=3232140 RepID=UPI003458C13C
MSVPTSVHGLPEVALEFEYGLLKAIVRVPEFPPQPNLILPVHKPELIGGSMVRPEIPQSVPSCVMLPVPVIEMSPQGKPPEIEAVAVAVEEDVTLAFTVRVQE